MQDQNNNKDSFCARFCGFLMGKWRRWEQDRAIRKAMSPEEQHQLLALSPDDLRNMSIDEAMIQVNEDPTEGTRGDNFPAVTTMPSIDIRRKLLQAIDGLVSTLSQEEQCQWVAIPTEDFIRRNLLPTRSAELEVPTQGDGNANSTTWTGGNRAPASIVVSTAWLCGFLGMTMHQRLQAIGELFIALSPEEQRKWLNLLQHVVAVWGEKGGLHQILQSYEKIMKVEKGPEQRCSTMSSRPSSGASIVSNGSGASQATHYRTLSSADSERKRTVAACRALRAQITGYEVSFIQLHGRPPKGAAERAPLATTYSQYREWKRVIRADAACRIQALFRGARTRWIIIRSDDKRIRNLIQTRAGRGALQSSDMPLKAEEGPKQCRSSLLPAPSKVRSNIASLSLSEVQAKRRELKRQLKQYDTNFARKNGRMPTKAEKEPIRHLYENYNTLKSQIAAFEQGDRHMEQITYDPSSRTFTGPRSLEGREEAAAPIASILRERFFQGAQTQSCEVR